MTKEQLFTYHQEMCERLLAITQAKNADYTANSSSPFANFERAETLGITTTEKAFLTRMADKLSRLASVIDKPAAVGTETVQDTLDDLANYCILLSAYIEAKKPTPIPPAAFQMHVCGPHGWQDMSERASALKPVDTRVSDHTELWEARCP